MLLYLLKYLGYKVTDKTQKELPKGFLSITELSSNLDNFKIANISVRLLPAQLSGINYPAIAHCEAEGQMPYFVILKWFRNEVVGYYQEGVGEVTEAVEVFSQKWSGVAMLLAPNEYSGEPNYAANKKQEIQQQIVQWVAWGAVGVAFLLGGWLLSTWGARALWVLAWVGAAASALLLANETGQLPAFAQKLCNLNSKDRGQSGCSTIAQSVGSKIFGWLSWSEVGLLYFLGASLSLWQNAHHSSFIAHHLLAALFVPYSIYYQAFVVKKWCALCLVVQGVLVAMAAVAWNLYSFKEMSLAPFGAAAVAGLGASYAWVIGGWFWVRKAWLERNKAAQIEQLEANWHRNSSVFMAYLSSQPLVNLSPLPNEDQIGNTDAPVVVTMVSNPQCNPCQAAYEELTALQRYFEDEMQLRIRHINSQDPNHQTHQQWATEIGIAYTPTLYINGRQVTEPYSVKDIQYHIRALAEASL